MTLKARLAAAVRTEPSVCNRLGIKTAAKAARADAKRVCARTDVAKALERSRRVVRRKLRGLEAESGFWSDVVALARKIDRGLDAAGTEAAHAPTAGSRKARRHRSTSGKRDATGRAEERADVAWLHGVRMAGVADTSFAGGTTAENRAFRYGETVPERVCLT